MSSRPSPPFFCLLGTIVVKIASKEWSYLQTGKPFEVEDGFFIKRSGALRCSSLVDLLFLHLEYAIRLPSGFAGHTLNKARSIRENRSGQG